MKTEDQIEAIARRLRSALEADGVAISRDRSREIAAAVGGDALKRDGAGREGADGTVSFTSCSPIIRIFDEGKAKEFYLGFLGFEPVFEHRFAPDLPLYMSVRRAGLSLHLSEHHGDASPGANMFIVTENVRALHRELAGKAYAYGRPGLESLPWGLQLEVHDPFGNRIRFCQQDEPGR